MRAEMYADDNAWYSAEYEYFKVDNETTEYQLNILGYSGDAGDQLSMSDKQTFSTHDLGMHSSMAMMMEGGWWFWGFDFACLNGAQESVFTWGATGFYWNSNFLAPPPEISGLYGVTPGRLLMSRIMITRP